MANEAATAFAFLYSTLHGDATLMALVSDIYRDVAPDGAVSPFVVFAHQAATDVLTATAKRVLTRDLYQVKVVGPEDQYATIKSAADRVDALLALVRNSGSVIACYRDGLIALAEEAQGSASNSGPAWLSLGGVYRIEI